MVSSRAKKLLDRLVSCPKDYTWDELTAVLGALGFSAKGVGGSRYTFRHRDDQRHVIKLHKPHGRNPAWIHRHYLVEVVERLEEWGYTDD